MPPLSRIHTPALDKLARELRYAPREALVRDVGRVEELAGDIDPAGSYPEDFVVFRVTGFRPDTGQPSLLTGTRLLADLSALVERMCDAAGLRVDELPTGMFDPAPELCKRWNVSRKTLDRWRREGLIARRVLTESMRPTLVIMRPVAEKFAATHPETLKRASGFSRLGPELESRMLRRARVYRGRFGCSLNQAAVRLARRYKRSPEAIRQLLKRHDGKLNPPAGTAANTDVLPRAGGTGASTRGSISQRERRTYYRASLRGLDPVWIAKRTRRAAVGVRRAINIERAAALRALAESGTLLAPISPTFARPEAAEVLLKVQTVRLGLGAPGLTDLAAFLEDARERTVPLGAEEIARRTAMCFLLYRARNQIEALDRGNPSAQAIDRIETDLRWTLRLKAELMRPHWALAIETVESQLGRDRGMSAISTELLPELIASLRDALAEAVDHYEPFRSPEVGARLAGSVSVVVARIGARWAKRLASQDPRGARAQTRILPGTALGDWTRRVATWQPLVDPPDRAMARVSSLESPLRRLIEQRLGLGGVAPHTLMELSRTLGRSATRLAREERTALRHMLGLRRRP